VLSPESSVFLDRSAEETPESVVMSDIESENLSLALDQLPPDQRACIELVDLAECSYIEAAGILEVPVGTVRSRLSRARLFIASRLTLTEDQK
jgi:RNA polymerase sigma-70 factor (ECF subfamily)